jgi:hypothetical protein
VTAQSLLAREARILRLRLEFGLVTLEEIEHWAEAALIANAEAPYEVVEVAMARSAGAKEAIRSLAAIGGEVADAKDVVLALAAANLDDFTPRQMEALFRQIAGLASSFLSSGTPESDILVGAYGPSDELFHALHEDNAWIERAMLSARAYFRQISEMAASLGAPRENGA